MFALILAQMIKAGHDAIDLYDQHIVSKCTGQHQNEKFTRLNRIKHLTELKTAKHCI